MIRLSPSIHAALRLFLPFPLGLGFVWSAIHLWMWFETTYQQSVEEWMTLLMLLSLGVAFFLGLRLPGIVFHLIHARCPVCGVSCDSGAGADGSYPYTCRGCGWHKYRLTDPGSVVGGLLFLLVGVGVIILSVALPAEEINGPRWGLSLIGLAFMVTGLLILGIWELILGLLTPRFPVFGRIDWHGVLGSLIATGAGVILLGVARFSQDEMSFPSGRGSVYAACGAFLIAGVSIFLGHVMHLPHDGPIFTALGVVLLSCFSAIPICIAIHDNGVPHPALFLSAAVPIFLVILGIRSLVRWAQSRGTRKL